MKNTINTHTLRTRILTGVLALGLSCSSASALDFTFSQGGFAEGATVSGSFSGEDTSGNGYLSYFPFDGIFEITAFSLSFSGNSSLAAFTLGLPDLELFSFKLGGDGVLGNDIGPDLISDPYAVEGVVATNGFFTYLAGQGPLSADGAILFDDNGGAAASASNPTVPVARVPDAGSTAVLFGAGMLGLFAMRHRKALVG